MKNKIFPFQTKCRKITHFSQFDPFYLENCKRYKKMLGVTFNAFFTKNQIKKNPSKSDNK